MPIGVRLDMRECAQGDTARMNAQGTTDRCGKGKARGDVPPAARRALEEAMMRHGAIDKSLADRPEEVNGAEGPEPTRHGDWERKGLASDF
ncbi:MAG: DUF1674 domain-containing protein [Hyphomicrobiales bacterium]